MTLVSLRPILTLGVGIVIGLLIAWGVFGRSSIGSPNTPVVSAATPNQSGLQAEASSTPVAIQQALTLEPKPSASASSSSSPAPQVNGLPLGVTQDALNYNKELYNKYPGLQPPVINTDGRDLGPEATQRLQGPPTMLPNPGGTPLASTTPAPFPSLAPLPFPFQNQSANPAPTASVQ